MLLGYKQTLSAVTLTMLAKLECEKFSAERFCIIGNLVC
jgi:hypothetical protein